MSQDPKASSIRVTIRRIYGKNHQFMVQVPLEDIPQPWEPQIEFQANPRFTLLSSGNFEVTLGIQIKGHQNAKALFEIYLEQAGLFTLEGIAEDERDRVLYGACPNLLFPYATANLNLILSQAALPPVYLAPLDFIALHAEHQKQQSSKEAAPAVEIVQ